MNKIRKCLFYVCMFIFINGVLTNPIFARYLTDTKQAIKEDVDAVKNLPGNTVKAGQRIGDAAGDLVDSALAGATQGVNPINDYQKSIAQREAANRIHRDNPQLEDGTSVKDVLNNKDQYSPEHYRDALNIYGGYVANELGVDPSSVHIYAQDDGNAGMSDRDKPNAYVNAENTNMIDTEQLVGVTSHELGHQRGENETEAECSRKQGVRAWNSENKYNGEASNVGTSEGHQNWNQSNQDSVVFKDGNKSADSIVNADYLPTNQLVDHANVQPNFGNRETHPVTGEKNVHHDGVDITGGTDIHAAADGVVRSVKTQKDNNGNVTGYGNYVDIKHFKDDGTYLTRYAHGKSPSQLSVGDKVYEGDKILEMGNSGTSSGTHLHHEIRKLNPETNKFDIIINPVNDDGTYKNLGNFDSLQNIPKHSSDSR